MNDEGMMKECLLGFLFFSDGLTRQYYCVLKQCYFMTNGHPFRH